MKSLITLSAAVVALVASNASFAAGNDIDFGYMAPATTASQVSRADVKAQAKAAHNMAGELLGNEDDAADTTSNVSREDVRKEAIEYVRTHRRELAELA